MFSLLQEIAPLYAHWRYGRISDAEWQAAKGRWQEAFSSFLSTATAGSLKTAFEPLSSLSRLGDPRWLWGTLCECLQDADLSEEMWQILTGLLASWPPALRRVPDLWAASIVEGHPAPNAWRLCKMMDLSHRDIPSRHQSRLFEHPALATLVHLDLSSNGLRLEAFHSLAASPFLRNLRRLDLRDVGLRSDALSHLASSSSLASLHSLDISANLLDPSACAILASGPAFAQLRTLNLGGSSLDSEGFRAFCHAASFPHLVRLLLWNNPIGGDALSALSSTSFPSTLEEIDLAETPIGDEGALALSRLSWQKLHTLILRSCQIGPTGLAALAHASLPALHSLNLVRNPLRDPGLHALLTASYLPALRTLSLRKCHLTRHSLEALFSLDLPALEKLDLLLNDFTSDDLPSISLSSTFQTLVQSGKIAL